MAGWERPVDKETPYVAEHVNQIIDVLTAQFGITDTIQTNAGRLALPAGAAPLNPILGQMWVDTSVGVDGARLYMRHGNNRSVPYMPMRQEVKTTELAASFNTSSTSLTDTGLTTPITTTGGMLEIRLRASVNGVSGLPEIQVSGGGGSDNTASLAAVIGATVLETRFGVNGGGPGNSALFPASAFSWYYKPVAGTYTVKIQGRSLSGVASLQLFGAAGPIGVWLEVIEWGD